ncbi:hypothetical protein SDC9_128002 [bioreactor metagenome]|uniref:Uncharacterized protein n=1 Tax=bioreactor metagenome TaxID=1076179 RepID=A0A645CVL5_9ZZZZ
MPCVQLRHNIPHTVGGSGDQADLPVHHPVVIEGKFVKGFVLRGLGVIGGGRLIADIDVVFVKVLKFLAVHGCCLLWFYR